MTINNACPTKLYKFKSLEVRYSKDKDIIYNGIEHVEDMLQQNQIWFSSPTEFNDPFECSAEYDIGASRDEVILRKMEFLNRKGKRLRQALAQAEDEIPQDHEGFLKQQIHDHYKRVGNSGILSLTHINDNQLMWTHYANSHSGVCIQFRCQSPQTTEQINFIGDALYVRYVENIPQIDFIRGKRIEMIKKAFFTKPLPYKYEEEWRIVKYDEGTGFKPIPKGIIACIILGVRIEVEDKNRIINACTQYEGDVEIKQAYLDPETYGLKFKSLMTV